MYYHRLCIYPEFSMHQAATFCYLNPPSKASGIAVAIFSISLKTFLYSCSNAVSYTG